MIDHVEQLVAEIMREHLKRLDLCQTVPYERRGRRRRNRPKTAIIADAAKEATLTREWIEKPES